MKETRTLIQIWLEHETIMSGAEFTNIRVSAGLSNSQMADLLQVSIRSVMYYQKQAKVPGYIANVMQLIKKSGFKLR